MEKREEKQRREKGFTLLEVIIAISILTFGLLAIASMQTASIRGNAVANRLTEGTTWAQDKLEELLALPDTDADLSSGSHEPETAISGKNSYTVSWDVIDNVNPADPINNAKLISVTVAWQDRGVTRITQLNTVKPQFF